MIVENHMNADAEIKAFVERNGTTKEDLIIAVAFVPHERRPGETAKQAYERELASMPKR
jgi:hypothetical protein